MLVGRDLELGLLSSLFETVKNGAARTAVVEGEAGIGKSALIRVAIERSAGDGIRILTTNADEVDVDRPFGLLSDLFTPHHEGSEETAQLVDLLFPAQAKLRPDVLGGGGAAVIEKFIDVVEAITSQGPTALVLEDIQWADVASLTTLSRIVRRAPELPLGMIFSFRTPLRRSEVARLISKTLDRDAVHIALPPLDDISLSEIAKAQLGLPPGRTLFEKLQRTGGNPFFATQLLRAYGADDRLIYASESVDVDDDAFPPSLSETILRRVRSLGSDVYSFLRRAAILGRSFAIRDLPTVTGEERAEILKLVEIALDAGLLRGEGELVGFHHDLVREVLYYDTAEAVRREIHRDVALSLAQRGASPLAVATHISAGAHHGDTFEVEWLRRAAREAARHDPGVGATFMAQAIRSANDHAALSQLRSEHVEMSLWTGDSPATETLARGYLKEQLEPLHRAAITLALVRAMIAQTRFGEAAAEAMDAISNAPQGSIRARLATEAAFAHLFTGMLDEAFEIARDARIEATACNDDFAEASASFALSLACVSAGRTTDGVAEATSGLARAFASRDPEFARGPFISLGAVTLLFCERLDEAEDANRRGLQLLTRAGTAWMTSIFHSSLGHVRYLSGRWDDALAEYDTAILAAEESGNTAPLAGLYATQAQILARRGDLDAGVAAIEEGQRLVDAAGGVHWNAPDVARTRAVLAEMQGDTDRAFDILTNLWQMVSTMGLPGFAFGAALDVAFLAARHQRDDALQVVLEILASDDIDVPPSQRAAALCARGVAAHDPTLITEGLHLFATGRNILLRCIWSEEAAVGLYESGRADEARGALSAAAELYETLGALNDLARMQQRARRFGVHIAGRGTRPRAKIGWNALTKTELRVAELVAEGLRNSEIASRLFISPRTVETHLTKVYDKLEIRSRAQLVRIAVEQDTARSGIVKPSMS